ncbi:CDP-alcohol phosphatidyltransferase family protein [Aliiroseovarius subalbicans]|uniref:CDP-alcohol phosphatidyltransferase family protein n=1 Tax=Aliiroseovarius subalbicans TaxID=2925840 RepID=UPI001F56BC43|nr:CDP-alcohol phosphatidyltransferase family protein [Aliiroseovarius subalbicans]MCI2399440.1 CDP-alcohol phosphatidyltransferase family protein [Aliiroseovarius subalbicans]
MTEPNSRRPIASRDTKLAQRFARWLAGTPITPNAISAGSVLFAAVAGAGFWMGGWGLLLAAVAVQGRLLCNLFDGMVAVEGGKSGPDGAFWNEAPDRLADILILVGLGLAAGTPALGWAAATFAVLTAYLREAGHAEGMDPDFSGPMAKPQRMAVATAAAIFALFVP